MAMVKAGKPDDPPRTGLEFLESDTELFNALVDAHTEYPSVIGRFNIQLVNEKYLKLNQEDVNNIFVLRLESRLMETGFMYRRYRTINHIVIRVSQYDTERAMALVKTTIKAIKQVLLKEPFVSHTKLHKIIPEYSEPGRLTGCVLKLYCFEVDEDVVVDDEKLMVELQAKASIEHLKEYEKIFPPMSPRKRLPLPKREKADDEYFAGG